MENQEESLISQEILDILLDPLYCDTGTTTTNRVEFILADFTLNWEKIAQLSEPKGLQERLFMFHAKTLRSKRRETLQKTLQLLPQIHSWLISLSEVVEKIFNLMQNSQEFWDCVPKDKLKKLLRKIQKYSENLTQSTQISSNDWIKSSSVMDKSVEMFAKVMQLVNF
ncbi:uncharacterized protein LOC129805808 isoform X2 [Phlebotomus papatasi]|uniref:uncharacterized protein LOC129805808 isoform X2 n=1 Tax=Phlebotomus papatasi TaxID=29031 RepID=UPI002483C0A2|nr:uncharacterized protein LOC129805808 isoform X2 [Phlebotomus papatasi]